MTKIIMSVKKSIFSFRCVTLFKSMGDEFSTGIYLVVRSIKDVILINQNRNR